MRRVTTGLLALLMVLAGVVPAGAAVATSTAETATQGGPAAESALRSSQPVASSSTSAAPPDDPSSDRLGWEDGYWYNESIDVEQSDGLSDAELDAIVGRAMARVERIRQLEFETTVPVEIMTRSEFKSDGNTSYNKSFRAFDNAKFEAMLMVGEDTDSLAEQQANRESNVLGFYSPAADSIVIITENESTLKMDELTLAHELVHALQDQHFDLLTERSAETRDGVNANLGVIEGDAKYVEHEYRDRCGGDWGTCTKPSSEGSGGGSGPANWGVYFLKFQPYSDGPTFIGSVYEKGGWDAVNALYNDTPSSAEQVIRPDAYGDDQPTNVSLTDRTTGDWERIRPPNRVDYAEVGQAGVASMFAQTLYIGRDGVIPSSAWLNYKDSGELNNFDPLNYGFDYAAGWDGDRMHFYWNDEGERAYVWKLVWDSPADAEEFAQGYVALLKFFDAEDRGAGVYRIPDDTDNGFADAFHVAVEGDTVTIVNAPTVDQLTEVRTGISTTPTETPTTSETATSATGGDTLTDTDDTPSATEVETPSFTLLVGALGVLLAAFVLFRE